MLTGQLESAIGNLQSITSLVFSSNLLSGSLPTTLGKLSTLEYLELQINKISKLCTELGNLVNLQYLYLFSNELVGTIPYEFGGLVKVSRLWLFNNSLSGPIPDSIYDNCISMWDLNLNTNKLSGSISSKIGKLSNLTQIFLFENFLTGSIPLELTKLPLEYIQLNNNNLQGRIPSGLGKLPIRYLWLQNNQLSNTIPSSLGQLTTAEIIQLYNNSLTGTIPASFNNLINATLIFIHNNSISGSLPNLSNLSQLECLNVEYNQLTGTVGSYLFNLPRLKYLYLSNNQFSGQVSSVSNSSLLSYLYLQNNRFSGNLPLGIFDRMVAINLSGNKLKGNLQDLFNESLSYSTMQYLIMSNLILSGSLPDTLFNSKLIESIVLSSNCITSSIPKSICNATSLTSLVLDGVSSSKYCPSSSPSFGGQIPECIFTLPNLQTLHISASGLTGTLPKIIVNSSIQDLSLSYNRLEGTVPVSMLEYGSFSYLDISTNRLSGLVDRFVYNSTQLVLNMSLNRFSGPSPIFDSDTASINILQGNLFSCPKPSIDIHADSVECGSRNYTLTYLTGFLILFMWIIASLLIFYAKFELTKKVKLQLIEWWNAYYKYFNIHSSSQESFYHTRSFFSSMELIGTLALSLCLIFLLIVMIAYIVLHKSSSYSQYTYQYLYTPTVGFLEGVGPSVLVVIFIAFSGFFTATWLRIEPVKASNNGDSSSAQVKSVDTKCVVKRISYPELNVNYTNQLKHLGLHLFITAVSLGINFGFVAIVYNTNISPFSLAIVQFIYALIKSLLVQVYIPIAVKYISGQRQGHIVCMIIVVMVVSPAVAVMFLSPLCLYKYYFPDSITSNYIYPQYNYGCILRGIHYKCYFYKLFLTETEHIIPQWNYSYQCSSSLLTSYLTNFNFLYIINGMIVPILNFIFIFLSSEEKLKNSMIFSKVLCFFSESDNVSIFRVFDHPYSEYELETISSNNNNSISNDNSQDRDSFRFSALRVLPNFIVDITILLTFGLASPLLSILILFNILSTVFLWRIAMGRYFLIVNKFNSQTKYMKRLESIFSFESECLKNSWSIMSIFISLFWALFVFDMLGNISLIPAIVTSLLFIIIMPTLFIMTDRFYKSKTHEGGRLLKFHNVIWNKFFYGNIRSFETNNDSSDRNDRIISNESTLKFTTSPFNHNSK